jgi:hypothetical protein
VAQITAAMPQKHFTNREKLHVLNEADILRSTGELENSIARQLDIQPKQLCCLNEQKDKLQKGHTTAMTTCKGRKLVLSSVEKELLQCFAKL